MRKASKIMLLAVAAVSAMAFAAPTASAQTVEIYQEASDTGENEECPPLSINFHVPTGGCNVHIISTIPTTLFAHNGTSEMIFSQCNQRFEARFNSAGVGYIYNQTFSSAGPVCGRLPCDESEAQPTPHQQVEWPATLSEAGPSNREQETLTTTFCARQPGAEGSGGSSCTVTLNIIPIGHAYEISTPPHDGAANGAARCQESSFVEMEGHWVTNLPEDHPEQIEIMHLDP